MVPVLVWTMPNKDASPEDIQEDKDAALGGLLFGIPSVAWGAWLARGLYKQAKQEQCDRLNSTFYRLIKESDGKITVLRLAMESKLPGKAAKEYLDEKAKEFQANFEVTESGDIIYHFHL